MTRIDEIEAAQANLPTELRRDRATIEADEHVQDLRRASFGRGHLTEEELTVSRGITLEKIALSNLGLEDVDRETEEIRLAQGLELQGRFEEASHVHPHQEEKERLIAVKEAIEADDDQFCNCPTTTTKVGEKDVEVQPYYEVKKIYSRKHAGMVSLVACQDCGHLNASPNPPEQLQRILQAHHTSSVSGKQTEHEKTVLK